MNRRSFLQGVFSMLAAVPVLSKLLPTSTELILTGATASNARVPVAFAWYAHHENPGMRILVAVTAEKKLPDWLDCGWVYPVYELRGSGQYPRSFYTDKAFLEYVGGRWVGGELHGQPAGTKYDLIDWPYTPRSFKGSIVSEEIRHFHSWRPEGV